MSTLKVTHLQNESNSAPSISISNAVGGGVTFAGISTFHGAVKLEDGLHGNSTNTITASTNGSERLRIDSSGRLLLGSSSTIFDNNFGIGMLQATNKTGYQHVLISGHSNSAGNATCFSVGRSRGTQASPAYLQSGDHIARFSATSYNGGNYQTSGSIDFFAADNHASGDLPGYISFNTVLDGSTNNTEKLRITAAGNVGINKIAPADRLHVGGKIRFGNNSTYYGVIEHEEGVTGANIYTSADSGGHIFKKSTTTQLTIDTSGNANIADGNLIVASGHGIDFSATADGAGSSQNELFDDYEEGYWTPTVNSGGNPSSTLTVTRARYTKIGRQVTIGCELGFTGGDGGNFRLQGLPFNTATAGTGSGQSGAGMNAVGAVLFNNLNITGLNGLGAYIYSNLIYFYYTAATDGASWTELDGDHVGGNSSGGNLIFTVTYST